jgi:ABC-type Na+ transport system ATPase subunit NatA
MSAIVVRNLSKTFAVARKPQGVAGRLRSLVRPSYRSVQAVRDVSFAVEAGESLAFLGPNGAGKSTTIKMLTGLLSPTGGSASVLGLDPQKDRKRLSFVIGTVFGQKSQLWYHLPALDSLRLLGAVYEVEPREHRRRIGELTERFGLADLLDVPVRKLSLGQRIRCELAASLLHRPRLLFLDEPTIGLDVVVSHPWRGLGPLDTPESGLGLPLPVRAVDDRLLGRRERSLPVDPPEAHLGAGDLPSPGILPGDLAAVARADALRLVVLPAGPTGSSLRSEPSLAALVGADGLGPCPLTSVQSCLFRRQPAHGRARGMT